MTSQIHNGFYFVYHLIDPRDGAVFYVGMSERPHRRLKEHHNDPASSAWGRCIEIRELGLRVGMRVVGGFWTKESAREAELKQIMTMPELDNMEGHRQPCWCHNHVMRRELAAERARAKAGG